MRNLLESVRDYIDQGMEFYSIVRRNKICYGYTYIFGFRSKDGTKVSLLYDPLKDKLKLKSRDKADMLLEKIVNSKVDLDDLFSGKSKRK